MPLNSGKFVLDTDASANSIGAVLSRIQGGQKKVIAYASRGLDKREMNYCVTRKELLAVEYFLKYFRQYILGTSFTIRTDHAPLTWLRKTPDPIGQQARWLDIMEEFEFGIEHRPGKNHENADTLSRMPCPQQNCAIQVSKESDKDKAVDWSQKETIKAQFNDEDIATVRKWFEEDKKTDVE